MGCDVPVGWAEANLGAVAEVVSGFAFKGKDFKDEGPYRLLRGANVSQQGLDWSATRYWHTADGLERYVLQHGDVILAMDRPWLEAGLKYARVTSDDLPALLVQRVARLRTNDDVDQRFLYYLLGHPAFTEHVRAVSTGSTVPHISGRQIEQFAFPLPPVGEQGAIAEVLGSLDDRIDWCQRTADRLLDGLGLVADGGSVRVPVSDLARYVNGGAFTKEATDTGRLIIRISELSSGVSGSSKYSDTEALADRVADPGDILFSWSATLDVYRWCGEQALINQHIFKVIPGGLPAWLVYAKLSEVMPEFQKIAADRATTMGHIKKSHLSRVHVDIFDPDELQARNGAGEALWDKHLQLSLEANQLRHVRDTLLPELITGRLRIPDVDGLLQRAGPS